MLNEKLNSSFLQINQESKVLIVLYLFKGECDKFVNPVARYKEFLMKERKRFMTRN